MSQDQKVQDLARVDLFSACTKKELQRLAAVTDRADVRDGHVLCHEGGLGRECFIVREGRVRVTMGGVHIADIGPGEVVGEMALLGSRWRVARAVAEGPVSVYVIDSRNFHAIIEMTPTLTLRMLRTLSDRLADLQYERLVDCEEGELVEAS